MKLRAPGVLVAALLSSSILSGCGVALSSTEEIAAPTAPVAAGKTPIGHIQGKVYGGGIPVTGAQIYLYQASQAGYGATTAGAASNRSISLLNNNSTTNATADTVTTDISYGDSYVTTDGNGEFNISGDYTCTPGTQLYLFSLGGNPGYGGVNSAIGLLTALPPCPTGGTLAGQVSYIYMNEVSTVAMAYAVAGFAHDAVHIGAPNNTLAQTGIANAFLNASNLYDIAGSTAGHGALPSGAVRTNSAAGVTRPTATVNSLANVLQYCVNSFDSAPTPATPTPTNQSPTLSSSCTTLFSSTGANNATATTAGTTSTAATPDTATAAMFIAQHPGKNTSNLYTYAITSATAYTPKLTAVPNDFSVQLAFTGGGIQSNYTGGTFYAKPNGLAIDSLGDAWVVNNITGSANGTTVSALGPLGAPLSSSSGFAVGTSPFSIAIDQSGYAWVSNFGSNSVSKLYATATGTQGSNVSGSPFTWTTATDGEEPLDTQIDASGNAWVMNYYAYRSSKGTYNAYGDLLELTSAGAVKNNNNFYTTFAATVEPSAVAIAPSSTVWVVGQYYCDYFLFTSADVFSTDANPASGTCYAFSGGMGFDTSGSAWYPQEEYYLNKTTSGGTSSQYTLPTQYYIDEGLSLALDGSSNVWVSDFDNDTIYEYSNTGTVLSPTFGFIALGNSGYSTSAAPKVDANYIDSLAVDGSGDVWYRSTTITSSPVGSLVEIIGVASPVATPIAYGLTNSKLGARP